MNVKPKFVYYDIRRKQSVCLTMYTHENDVDTQVLEVSMLDNGEPIELSVDYTYSAAIVNRDTKALINDNISCELNDSENVLIPIDNFHTLGAQDLLIELTITDSTGDQVLVTPFPLWIHVNASILDDAEVTPESEGTVPELLEEAKEALENAGNYESIENKPQINGHELVGNKSSDDLGLQGKLTAGENITIEDNVISAEGGVTDYDELENKPQINGITLSGNKSATDLELKEIFFGTSNPPQDSYTEYPFHALWVNLDENTQFVLTAIDYSSSPLWFTWERLNNRVIQSTEPAPEYSENNVKYQYDNGDLWLQVDSGKITKISVCTGKGRQSLDYKTWRYFYYWAEFTGGGSQIVSGVVNANGTITFTMSDGSTVTTKGQSVIGPQGPVGADGDDYVLTAQDKQDIADIVLSELPTTQGVQYGNTSN